VPVKDSVSVDVRRAEHELVECEERHGNLCQVPPAPLANARKEVISLQCARVDGWVHSSVAAAFITDVLWVLGGA
jgi:hypothetical protein